MWPYRIWNRAMNTFSQLTRSHGYHVDVVQCIKTVTVRRRIPVAWHSSPFWRNSAKYCLLVCYNIDFWNSIKGQTTAVLLCTFLRSSPVPLEDQAFIWIHYHVFSSLPFFFCISIAPRRLQTIPAVYLGWKQVYGNLISQDLMQWMVVWLLIQNITLPYKRTN